MSRTAGILARWSSRLRAAAGSLAHTLPLTLPLALPLALALPLVLAACGDAAQPTAVLTPETGGTVALDEGTLEFPPGSLVAETAVTLRREPFDGFAPLAGAVGEVLTIDPADTVLERAAVLSFEVADDAVGPALSHWVDGYWVAQPTARRADGQVEIAISWLGSFALAQAADSSDGNRIDGVVRWGDGSPLAGLDLALEQDGTRLTAVTSDQAGRFGFADLVPGDYQITASFECELAADVTVTAAAPTAVELVMCGG